MCNATCSPWLLYYLSLVGHCVVLHDIIGLTYFSTLWQIHSIRLMCQTAGKHTQNMNLHVKLVYLPLSV
jgi:hypothetical protein